MSMMECGHCHRPTDSRSMQGCDGCGSMICQGCRESLSECSGDDQEYDP